MNSYTNKYLRMIKGAQTNSELCHIINKIYCDGFEDGSNDTGKSGDLSKLLKHI